MNLYVSSGNVGFKQKVTETRRVVGGRYPCAPLDMHPPLASPSARGQALIYQT